MDFGDVRTTTQITWSGKQLPLYILATHDNFWGETEVCLLGYARMEVGRYILCHRAKTSRSLLSTRLATRVQQSIACKDQRWDDNMSSRSRYHS